MLGSDEVAKGREREKKNSLSTTFLQKNEQPNARARPLSLSLSLELFAPPLSLDRGAREEEEKLETPEKKKTTGKN